ncbi:SDR family oxidoreductase [Nonomuraea sp. MTCD27]|uniref:SDR family oxidoreductase n=1 Tax=Nonomuraea sp. MTCD27 TaxID=1676747 RepID=UPI0035BF046E
MGQSVLSGEHGAGAKAMIEASNARRAGTAGDIAAAAAFLLDPATSYVSGADPLVDGGVTATARTGASSDPAADEGVVAQELQPQLQPLAHEQEEP